MFVYYWTSPETSLRSANIQFTTLKRYIIKNNMPKQTFCTVSHELKSHVEILGIVSIFILYCRDSRTFCFYLFNFCFFFSLLICCANQPISHQAAEIVQLSTNWPKKYTSVCMVCLWRCRYRCRCYYSHINSLYTHWRCRKVREVGSVHQIGWPRQINKT